MQDIRRIIQDERARERAEIDAKAKERRNLTRNATLSEKYAERSIERQREKDPKLRPLWEHQKASVEKARDLPFYGLFYAPGCGKTRSLISILSDKYLQHGLMKTLILCPPVVIENFKNEFSMYSDLPGDKVITFKGPMKDRLLKLRKLGSDPFVAITNYEILYNEPLLTEFKRWEPRVLVCDEIHKCKDPKAKRTKELIQLSDFCQFRYGLSGTPILNSLMDLFAQIRIIDGGTTFGRNFFVFRATHFFDANSTRKGTHSYFPNFIPKEGIAAKLYGAIAPFTDLVKKEDVLKFLPPLVKKQWLVELGPEQAKVYAAMKKDFIAFVNSEACTAELAITRALRLQQIVSGFVKFESGEEKPFLECPRLDALTTILQDLGRNKVIIWAVFKRNYLMIKNICGGLGLETCELTGETKDKAAEIAKFQDPNGPTVMVSNQNAGGVGVNLVQAGYMIYYSKNFSLEQDLQSEARNYRGGSEMHSSITRIDLISKGTIDEVILEVLKKKKRMGDEVFNSKSIFKLLREGV